MKYYLSFDVGTTAMKCILFDGKFKEVAAENMEYDLKTAPNGIAELDANVYYDTFCKCTSQIVSKFGAENIVSVAFTTQGETLIPIDSAGNPLCNAIVWLDTRAAECADYIKKNIDMRKFYSATGLPDIDGALPAAKVMWLKNNKPDLYENTYKFLLLEDYLIYRLTGLAVSERSLQS